MAFRLYLCSKLLRTDIEADELVLPKVTAGLAVLLLGTSAGPVPPMTTNFEAAKEFPLTFGLLL